MKDNEDKDSRLKYVEMGTVFKDRASAVDLNCKLSQKSCERFALYLAKQKPKTPEQFEKVEVLKDFVLKTSKANEEMMLLIDYMKGLIEDIATDSKILIEGAILRDKLKFQSDTIQRITEQRNEAIAEIFDHYQDELRKNTANS